MTQINRRTLLKGAATLPAAAALTGVASPTLAAGHTATPGAALYSAPLGRYRITALWMGSHHWAGGSFSAAKRSTR